MRSRKITVVVLATFVIGGILYFAAARKPIAAKDDIDVASAVIDVKTAGIGERFLPVQNNLQADHMEALISGELVEKDGCLRINDVLVVWPYGSNLNGDQVLKWNDDLGASQLIAKLGEVVTLGGGMLGEGETNGPEVNETIRRISSQLPSDKCTGPYWIVGQYEGLADIR